MNSTLETVRKYLYWNGSIRLGDIQRITGYGKTKANQIFMKIKDELGGQIEKKGHTYYLADNANLSFDSNEFLDDFYLSNKRQKPFYFSVPSLVIDPMLETNLDNEIIKTVLHALKNKLGIELDYVDAKRGATKERRTVFPLTL